MQYFTNCQTFSIFLLVLSSTVVFSPIFFPLEWVNHWLPLHMYFSFCCYFLNLSSPSRWTVTFLTFLYPFFLTSYPVCLSFLLAFVSFLTYLRKETAHIFLFFTSLFFYFLSSIYLNVCFAFSIYLPAGLDACIQENLSDFFFF